MKSFAFADERVGDGVRVAAALSRARREEPPDRVARPFPHAGSAMSMPFRPWSSSIALMSDIAH